MMAAKVTKRGQEHLLDVHVHDHIIRDITKLVGGSTNFKDQYLLSTFTSKLRDETLVTADVRREAAIAKWLHTEDRNARTNIRLYLSQGEDKVFRFRSGLVIDFNSIISFARKLILQTIGDKPSDILRGMFSGGATTSKRRDYAMVARKYVEKPDVTEDAWRRILPMLLDCTVWWQTNPEILSPRFVEGNIMFTVPKSTHIDRVCAKEPDLNLYFQRAIGLYFNSRLKCRGIDLNDQSINRKLAREGSVSGSLATLDLSSASDSISTQIVQMLLPFEWWDLLDSLRSKKTRIDGIWHENHMFSSMGNGFTFELESLIFWALSRSVCRAAGIRGRISVYGDDIIIPTDAAELLMTVLSFCGFKVNPEKSFWKGGFRESCGGHYYNGCEVTPFYIKNRIDNLRELIRFLNQFRKWSRITEDSLWCDPSCYKMWHKWSRAVPKHLRGSSDIDAVDALVSLDRPSHRLVEVVDRVQGNTHVERGAYLYTLNSYDRDIHPSPDESSSILSITRKLLVVRRVPAHTRHFGGLIPEFPQERLVRST